MSSVPTARRFSDPQIPGEEHLMTLIPVLHTLYDSLMDARREAGDDVVPFHRFAALVKDQVSKAREGGADEVAFRVAMIDGKVNFTVRPKKGGLET